MSLASAADPLTERAKQKIGLIEDDKAPPGSRIWISLEELNAYGRAAALEVIPQGLRSPRVELGMGTATGSATIDFLKVRELKGSPPNVLLGWLLGGEKPVKASARIRSGSGRATVLLDEVTVSGMTARGAVLDFLVENFLLPFYPDAKIGRPFELKHGVERLEISPLGVNVIIAGKTAQR